jgi:hypothetical protein
LVYSNIFGYIEIISCYKEAIKYMGIRSRLRELRLRIELLKHKGVVPLKNIAIEDYYDLYYMNDLFQFISYRRVVYRGETPQHTLLFYMNISKNNPYVEVAKSLYKTNWFLVYSP